MTRINAGIPPAELSDKHLLAEHREIKRIPNVVKSGRARIENIPEKFTLGKGHVKFFYNKLLYLHIRYSQIYGECRERGFNITPYHKAWLGLNPVECDLIYSNYNNWTPTPEAIALIKERIELRNNG